jgi:beta-glucosidase/6-phospho-beta-glucosidase/beta-galactosidase
MRLAVMGVKYYLFSISWTGILPFGLPGTSINSYGTKHYDDLRDFVLEQGILPVVTLLHFDPPLQLFGANNSGRTERACFSYENTGY